MQKKCNLGRLCTVCLNKAKNQRVFEQSGPEEENYFTMGVGTYNYTFKSVVFESVKVKSVKIKKILRRLRMVQKSFMRRFENDTLKVYFLKV